MITPTIDEGRLMGFEVSLPCPTCGLAGCHLTLHRWVSIAWFPTEEIALAHMRRLQQSEACIDGPCSQVQDHAHRT